MAKKRVNGEGSISRLPSGTWRAQVVVDGRRLSHTAKLRDECTLWVRQTLNQVDQGFTYSANRQTVAEYLREWFQLAQPALKPKTAHQYQQYIEKRIIPKLGNVHLSDLRLDRVERFYADLINEGAGARSVRYIHRVLHRALEKAATSGQLPRNPAHGASLPRVVQPEMSALEESQVSQFLVTANGTRYEALYRLAIATGMRQGELLGLKWPDIDWNKGVIHVRRQVQRVTGKGFIFDEPKTRAGRRSVRVGQNVLQSLAQHKQRQELEIFYAGDRWHANDLVFPSTTGTPLDQRNLLRDYYAILKLAGLPRIRFHDLRHTAASLLISHETPINVVSAMLGHSKPSVTLDIYAHVYSGRQEQAAC